MLGPYKGYISNVNAAVSVETESAAYRYGHGILFRKAFALPYGYDLENAGSIQNDFTC